MADQVIKGDDVIKNSASAGADLSEKACDNFQKELFAERDRSMQNGMQSSSTERNTVSNLQRQVENGSSSSGLAQGIRNAIRNDSSNNSGTGSIADVMARAVDNNRINDNGNSISSLFENFKKLDGVKQLATGDYLVREDGKETLFTPNGDRVTVNPDGTHVIKGDVKSVTSNRYGDTTVTFADGSKVIFDKEGILDVRRGKQSVSFPRFAVRSYRNDLGNSLPDIRNLPDNSIDNHVPHRILKPVDKTLPSIELWKH